MVCFVSKKSVAATAKDLSLVHSLPKIISKVLASKLQKVMGDLINPHQAAFVKGAYT